MTRSTARRTTRGVLLVALVWFPFFGLYSLFMLVYVGAGVADSLSEGFSAAGRAALLGLGAWWFTGRRQWPARFSLGFYGVHLVAGSLYGAVWTVTDVLIPPSEMARAGIGTLLRSPILGWQFLMGLVLYGLVAGVSYTIRTHRGLRAQERIAARAEALAARAQLDALRARLNPHFLFNSIHSFAALIRHDPDAAERAAEKLGDLLRAVLDDGGSDEATVGDEWHFTQDYLALERLRLGDRLEVTADIDPRSATGIVPSFSLQPLVENAILHSVAPRTGGGRIWITTRVDDGQLLLEVEDDGPGASAETIRASEGSGLCTLRERLAALYGDQASLSTRSQGTRGFKVTVTVPWQDAVDRTEPVS